MMRFSLVVSVALFCIGCPKRDSRLDAPLQSQFEWTPVLTACDPVPQSGAILKVIPSTRFNLKRLDEVGFPISEAPALSLDVQSSLVSVEGSNVRNYDARLCAEAGAASHEAAAALLERIRFRRDGSTLRLVSPMANSREEQSSVNIRVTAPRDAPLSISGTYAALAVHGINAPVKLTTTHARITVLETTEDVDADVKEFGIIDFAGTRGRVRLDAPTEINLKFTGQKFDGTLRATADGPIRVLLPRGFSSALEADVSNNSNFICHADICSQVKRSKHSNDIAFSYGAGEPQVHLKSANGAVALYNH